MSAPSANPERMEHHLRHRGGEQKPWNSCAKASLCTHGTPIISRWSCVWSVSSGGARKHDRGWRNCASEIQPSNFLVQADEDFLPVWNTRPESVEWRQGFGLA